MQTVQGMQTINKDDELFDPNDLKFSESLDEFDNEVIAEDLKNIDENAEKQWKREKFFTGLSIFMGLVVVAGMGVSITRHAIAHGITAAQHNTVTPPLQMHGEYSMSVTELENKCSCDETPRTFPGPMQISINRVGGDISFSEGGIHLFKTSINGSLANNNEITIWGSNETYGPLGLTKYEYSGYFVAEGNKRKRHSGTLIINYPDGACCNGARGYNRLRINGIAPQ